MNSTWQDFLQEQGAEIKDGIVQYFGTGQGELAAAQNGLVVCYLSHFGVLKVTGEDAETFLQNLLSSDVREVSPWHAQFSSLNNPKGRMLASLLIWRKGVLDDVDKAFFLQLPISLCADIQQRLSKYILRAKVKIEDVSDTQLSFGWAGENSEDQLREYLGSVPVEPWGAEEVGNRVSEHNDTGVIRLGEQRFQINTTLKHAPELWKKLIGTGRPVGSPCWDFLAIHDGIPIILPATQEQFVPQMTNMELIGAVNFKKGCYPGQEIVARMQYLGKLKRRMYLAHIESDTPPQPGDELYSADMEGQASGMIVNVSPAPDGGYDMLAVVQISSHKDQTVHWKSLQGAALRFMRLPYPIY
ncbi:CAF17-like 4Fe-4S cluster assembly/insertion protein YgfZ [Candidatus Nitrotoga sp. M5]|uniref:CAF17-like 4Fe-4S cluster assembly/insertion protein YgfZ n=1 Tax=Candidatus Nitrotoga sp. M5 TaxID=2890409 RepID=UPI001EF1F000|nr:folate-binding protein [Candidatus Nitrotoga sp. M5]CAH1385399.1 Folate-dependent protein for Fe/S cluster synthesis/repair in oxidative stress [Candidatus Nitrotoga sp. M5]